MRISPDTIFCVASLKVFPLRVCTIQSLWVGKALQMESVTMAICFPSGKPVEKKNPVRGGQAISAPHTLTHENPPSLQTWQPLCLTGRPLGFSDPKGLPSKPGRHHLPNPPESWWARRGFLPWRRGLRPLCAANALKRMQRPTRLGEQAALNEP